MDSTLNTLRFNITQNEGRAAALRARIDAGTFDEDSASALRQAEYLIERYKRLLATGLRYARR